MPTLPGVSNSVTVRLSLPASRTEVGGLTAARALAATIADDELSPGYIIPSVFHPGLIGTVAEAVRNPAVTAAGSRRD